MKNIYALVLSILLVASQGISTANAQCMPPPNPWAGMADICFSPNGTGFDAPTRCIAMQPDGKVLIGGDFLTYSGLPYHNMIRLNANGSVDASFSVAVWFDSGVYSVALQPDGRILVAGAFDSVMGGSQRGLVRLNADGSKDNSFNIGTGFNGTVRKVILQPDGKILAGGLFTTFNGTSKNGIIRLNADGTPDNGFTVGTGFNNTVSTLTLRADGKIYAGGRFTFYNGFESRSIIRLNANGTADPVFSVGASFLSSNISAIEVMPDGGPVVGGNFTYVSGTDWVGLAKLNADGSFDASYSSGGAFNNPLVLTTITSLLLQPDGKLLVGGRFLTYNSVSHSNLVRLTQAGTLDTDFLTGAGFDTTVMCMAWQNDGKVFVGGRFTNYNGSAMSHMTRLYTSGITATQTLASPTKMLAYPNPAQGTMHLQGQERAAVVYLRDVTGKTIASPTVQPGQAIDLRGFAPGLYRWQADAESGNVVVR